MTSLWPRRVPGLRDMHQGPNGSFYAEAAQKCSGNAYIRVLRGLRGEEGVRGSGRPYGVSESISISRPEGRFR